MRKFRDEEIKMSQGIDVVRNVEDIEKMVEDEEEKGENYIKKKEMKGEMMRESKEIFERVRDEEKEMVLREDREMEERNGVLMNIGQKEIDEGKGKIENRGGIFEKQGEKIENYEKINMLDVDIENGERWREQEECEKGRKEVIEEMNLEKVGMEI